MEFILLAIFKSKKLLLNKRMGEKCYLYNLTPKHVRCRLLFSRVEKPYLRDQDGVDLGG